MCRPQAHFFFFLSTDIIRILLLQSDEPILIVDNRSAIALSRVSDGCVGAGPSAIFLCNYPYPVLVNE